MVMNNNNWHVPLNKMNEQQLEIVERVYGVPEGSGYLKCSDGEIYTSVVDSGEEITAEEAFKRLGLDRLLELEQGLQDVDWPNDSKYIVQNGVCLEFTKTGAHNTCWKVLATRPKPKHTKEQIDAIRRFAKDAIPDFTVDEWLKEQGYDN